MRPGSPTFGGYEYQGGYNHAPRGPETTFDYGQRAEAVADFRKVLELEPGHPFATEQLQKLGEL